MASFHRRSLVHVIHSGAGDRNESHWRPRRRERIVRLVLLVSLMLVLLACGGSGGMQRVNLPPPSERTVVGPGDVFTMQIVGEKDLPTDYQIAADGSVDLPYIHSVKVAGLEAPEVARLIRERLIENKILNDPSVIVQVKEYHSRRITLLGQVAKPGTFPFTPGMTLIQAVSLAGGFSAIANTDKVNLTRKADDGRTYTAVLAVGQIMEGKSPDIPLQAGDQIYVYERLF
jgi:polysaccharide biosynthesis/export protein VpsN